MFKTASLKVPYIVDDDLDEPTLALKTVNVSFGENTYRVIHTIGLKGRNTDFNDVLTTAFRHANIDMPGRVVIQVDDLQTIDAKNLNNILLAAAFGIMQINGRLKTDAFDDYLVAGSLDITGKVYPPHGISKDILAAFAQSNGLKTLGATAAGCDKKVDTLVGLIK